MFNVIDRTPVLICYLAEVVARSDCIRDPCHVVGVNVQFLTCVNFVGIGDLVPSLQFTDGNIILTCNAVEVFSTFDGMYDRFGFGL